MNTRTTPSSVAGVPAATPDEARRHFAALLSFETDCWDVHHAMTAGRQDFVLLQTSASDESFAAEHIPGAIHLPHHRITADALAACPADTLFVASCAGPHSDVQ